MSKHGGSLVNVICSLLLLFTNVLINFWLSPFIIEHIGVEANGFITLANNFFVYACLITGALNSMAARFITIESINGNYQKANLYYNSVFWGKLIIIISLLLPTIYFIANLDSFINISNAILIDVKLLFVFSFFNFIIYSGTPNWECGTYISNRLNRDYIPNMATSVLKCIIIVAMMMSFVPKVWYVGFATTIATFFLVLARAFNTHTLTPFLEIVLNKGKFLYSWTAIKELISAGIWNSISSVGQILLTGLDLLICNIFLGGTAMGIIALSKILPTCIEQLSVSIRNAFGAEFVINYAKGDRILMIKNLDYAMKITSILIIIPVICVIVFGKYFFSLWVPLQNSKQLYVLTILAVFGYIFTSSIQVLYNVFGTVNKVKLNSIVVIISGIISILITMLFLQFTNLNIYAIVGVSSFVSLVRNIIFTIPISAVYLGFSWKYFFPRILRITIASLILLVLGFIIKYILPNGSWLDLIISVLTFSVLSILLSPIIFLNKREQLLLKQKCLSKINRSK